jgi:RES domain-containing protein
VDFWRICRAGRAASAFDGEGARLYPGRWNHKNLPMVYCAASLSLATLEYFVHADPDDMPGDLVSIRASLPDEVRVERLDPARLPADWRGFPGPDELRDIGSEWLVSNRTVALLVPSAITPPEENVLLNPRHPDMRRLTRRAPEPFAFDPRMWK